jgi:uncharacterized protein YggE
MRRLVIVAGLALVLCACEDRQKTHDMWVSQCRETEFSPKQCEVLFSVYRQGKDAKQASDAAAANAAFAAGAAIAGSGASGSRK